MNATVRTLQTLDRNLRALELDSHRLGKTAGWLNGFNSPVAPELIEDAKQAIAKIQARVDQQVEETALAIEQMLSSAPTVAPKPESEAAPTPEPELATV